MAKELPFFKFEPGAWDNGNIQMCSRESKGLFIDLCSIYWSRLGELPYALALQKLCNGNADALQELYKHHIFTIEEDMINISFLDEQLSEFDVLSGKRRNAANKRWKNANALQVQSKSNAIRGDKIRGDKIRIEPFSISDFFNNGKEAFEEIQKDEVLVERLLKVAKGAGFSACNEVSLMHMVKRFLEIETAKDNFTIRKRSEVKQHLVNWLNKNPNVLSNGK